MSSYSCSFSFPAGMINYTEDGIVEVIIPAGRTITPAEMAAAAAIGEIITRLRSGKMVKYVMNPNSFVDQSQLMKCEWLRSGNLKVHGPTDKVYRFVETRDAAVQEQRTFTCKQYLIAVLPKHRENPNWTAGLKKVSTGNANMGSVTE